jgi:predicted aspartyl protease
MGTWEFEGGRRQLDPSYFRDVEIRRVPVWARRVLALGIIVSSATAYAQASSAPGASGSVARSDAACVLRPTTFQKGFDAFPLTYLKQWFAVAVCINHHGPYPFIVDTGANVTVISSTLAAKLGLRTYGTNLLHGVGGSAAAKSTTLAQWSMGNVPMHAEQIETLPPSEFAVSRVADGFIGTDVLSRFGAIEIDYNVDALRLAEPEQAFLRVASPSSSSHAPLATTFDPEGAQILGLRIGPGEAPFVVGHFSNGKSCPLLIDSGAEFSLVSPAGLAKLALRPLHSALAVQGIGSPTDLPAFASGPWSLVAHRLLPEMTMYETRFFQEIPNACGTVGSIALSLLQYVIIDFQDGAFLI